MELLTVVVAGAGALFAALALARRGERLAGHWTEVDLLLALGVLVLATGALTAALAWWPGASSAAEGLSLGPVLAGTVAGEGLAVAVVMARVPRAALGWREVPPSAMAVAALLAFPVLGVDEAYARLLEVVGVPSSEQALVGALRALGDWPARLAAAVVVAALVPFLEEVLFRGFVIPPLERRWGPWWAVLSSGALFGLVHAGDGWAIPPLVGLGWVLGYLRLRSGSIWPGVGLHMANNALALVLTWGS